MKLRGSGDILGFKQSGEKKFNLADPVLPKIYSGLQKMKLKELKLKKLTYLNIKCC